MYNLPETSTDQEYLNEIQNTGIPNWQSCLELLEKVDQFKLPTAIRDRNLKLTEYCNLRIKTYELIHKAISDGTDAYQSEIETCNKEIGSIINELGN
jgi:rhomboid protease GluP